MITVFGTRPKDSIFLPTTPFGVRNDCQVGVWKVGDDDHRGKTIEISVIKVSQHFGNLGKTKNAHWMQIWFVPAPGCDSLPSNTVCVTYIKSRSISQFSQLITELMQSGEPALGIFVASFEKHSHEKGIYYSVKWDWKERKSDAEKKQLEQIANFLKSKPQLVDLSTNLIPIDGMSPEEVELMIRSAKSEQLEQPKQLAAAEAK